MPRALALVPDLLFASRLTAAAGEAGIELELVADEHGAWERLTAAGERGWDLLVVDLTDPQLEGAELVRSLRGADALAGARTLGFYAHVDTAVREQALEAGFDVVVPRSRMAREGAALLQRLSG